jgi:hypothetical protein
MKTDFEIIPANLKYSKSVGLLEQRFLYINNKK